MTPSLVIKIGTQKPNRSIEARTSALCLAEDLRVRRLAERNDSVGLFSNSSSGLRLLRRGDESERLLLTPACFSRLSRDFCVSADLRLLSESGDLERVNYSSFVLGGC